MGDIEYFAAVKKMDVEKRRSLMTSEEQRVRTYNNYWQDKDWLDYKKLAREGLYYTGICDRCPYQNAFYPRDR